MCAENSKIFNEPVDTSSLVRTFAALIHNDQMPDRHYVWEQRWWMKDQAIP